MLLKAWSDWKLFIDKTSDFHYYSPQVPTKIQTVLQAAVESYGERKSFRKSDSNQMFYTVNI